MADSVTDTTDSDVTHMRIDDLDTVEGFLEGLGFSFHRARAGLGVSSFGLSIIDMPPNSTDYPEHDHSTEGLGPPPDQLGQEEVYVALRGSGEVEVDGERYPLDADHVIRVGPTARRKPLPGPEGMRLLVIGAVPGQAYDPQPS
jgi:mannose-6-phosphate isomerase-like protein (cupin superfamily)